VNLLVYCESCGAKNPDDARVCTQCGKPLYFGEKTSSRKSERSDDLCWEWDEATGKRKLRRQAIIIIGGIIILWAINQLISNLFPEIESSLWALVIGVVGVLFLIYAIFFYGRER